MERCLVDRSEQHTPPLQHMHVLIRVSLLSYEARKLSCIFSQVAGERKGGLFLARVECGRGMAPGRWETWGVQWILAELNVFSVGNSCICLDWLFWNRLQPIFWNRLLDCFTLWGFSRTSESVWEVSKLERLHFWHCSVFSVSASEESGGTI